MTDPQPFTLSERPDGQRELRLSNRDGAAPIVLLLDEESGRRFGLAVADVLTALDAGIESPPINVEIDGRRVTVAGEPEIGLQLWVPES